MFTRGSGINSGVYLSVCVDGEMEKEERVSSPLGAPHLGMDYFPVFDSRLDDSPKFRTKLHAWSERSVKVGMLGELLYLFIVHL